MKKTIALVLLWSMPVLLAWSFFMQTHYANSSRPTAAEPRSGRVFALSVHGTVVYLTNWEYFSARRTFDIGMVAGIAGGLLWRSTKKKQVANDARSSD